MFIIIYGYNKGIPSAHLVANKLRVLKLKGQETYQVFIAKEKAEYVKRPTAECGITLSIPQFTVTNCKSVQVTDV